MHQEWTTIATADGPMETYVCVPEGVAPHPALVIAQEAFGVNPHIQDVCQRFAREGYVVAAPDIYHRTGRLLTYGYDDPKRREPFSQLTNSGIEADVRATLAHLRSLDAVAPDRVGIVGYCLGGFIAFLAACRTDVATAVVFYGGGIVNHREGLKLEPVLAEADRLKVPALGLFGDKDFSIPMAEIEAIKQTLEGQQRGHQVVVYAGADHGFFCDERSTYSRAAAADAWERTRRWLKKHLDQGL